MVVVAANNVSIFIKLKCAFFYIFLGQQATDNWYSEIKDYNFQRASGPNTGRLLNIQCYLFINLMDELHMTSFVIASVNFVL